MSLIYKNITGNTAVTLLDLKSENIGLDGSELEAGYISSSFTTIPTTSKEIKSIILCNVHGTDSVDVDLYYYNVNYTPTVPTNWNDPTETVTTYYIFKNTTIPKGVTLKLNEEDDITFDSSIYILKIKLSAADSSVDVIINTK